ncbi:MAG TPA: hypothetical protein VFI17_03565 [Solirubrobacterales bacterium]|nr:hypothetical protein [Solirubrobacterales bacterium]
MNPYPPKRLAVVLVGLLAPLIMAFSTVVANEAQTLLHLHLAGDALAAYLSTFLIAVGAVLFRLLEHEASRFLHGLVQLLLKSSASMPIPQASPGPPPPPPPGPTAVVPPTPPSA